MPPSIRNRCFGDPSESLMMSYHDEESGVPIHDDTRLFEALVLEGAQAGLSWKTILLKRQNFRKAFAHFNVAEIAAYKAADKRRLLADKGIVRNRLKIEAFINNAQCFLEVQQEYGSFDHYIWKFTDYTTLRRPRVVTLADLPVQTEESEAMSKDLKKRGYRFVGPTICYAFMQATGMADDHLSSCFRTLSQCRSN